MWLDLIKRKRKYDASEIKRNIVDEEEQLKAVKSHWLNIRYCINPTEIVQMEAVKQWGGAIEYIHNPTEAVQLEAVRRNGLNLKFIRNSSEDVQLEAVKQNGRAIQYIYLPTKVVKLEAVRQNGLALQYIKNPSKEIQLEALAQNPYVILYGTPELIDAYKTPLFKKENEMELDLLKLKEEYDALEIKRNIVDEEEQLKAVREYWTNIRNCINPTEKVQLEAVRQCWEAIEYISDPSKNVQLTALFQHKEDALKYCTPKLFKNLCKNPENIIAIDGKKYKLIEVQE